MAIWSVRTGLSGSILERKSFIKNGERITLEISLNQAKFLILTEDDISPNIALGTDLYNCGYECKLLNSVDYHEDDMIGDNRWLTYTQDGWEHDGHEMIVVILEDLYVEKVES